MNNKKKNMKQTWIQYSIFGAIALVLYATGLHTEVIGFAQRGLLETGLMNPDVEEKTAIAHVNNAEPESLKGINSNPEASFDLQLRDEEGNIVALTDFKGKVIFMNFWATWCPPCVAEMPAIDRLHQEMGDEVAFVMLSMDQNFEKAVSFKERKDYGLPIYELASQLPAMYRSTALPTTYVIDADGKLALTHKGMADYDTDEFKKFLKSLK
ncbi:TlpA family protein disulfide reductase [Christiangramia crocea]|uniref:TlpA family protein disulfide reductase n=1 Tax=Christiangramia crocea TaxID=2904124 RepID=A0A9X2A6J3_9FLAO|nr:TlpA disulfide reductase family protein [Gramella crocea]MCG9972165.1 TlpA family protein disulfide reductase [Gramella crocea]